ncbi:MAG: FtsX-like permease family protein [Brumimicrobium sp.]|nr:FtsX-like permease family protein [Brumimicrobium sp.]
MNKIYYIAQKIHKGKDEDTKVSQPIVRIARWSIILAVSINIITLAVVKGFQNKVQAKVIGFGSHATIVKAGENSTFETSPIVYDDSLIKQVENIAGIQEIYPFAYKPALIQSNPDTNRYTIHGIDTFQVQQEIHGIIVKGIGKNYDWSFFQENLVEGVLPNVEDTISHKEILVSSIIAKKLGIKLNEKVNIFFVKSVPIKLKFTVIGIFKTGLQEFDEQMILGDIRDVQQLNDWGIKTAIRISDTIAPHGQLIIYSETNGGNGNYRYDWGKGWENNYGFTYCDIKDTVIRLITSDYYNFIDGYGEENSIPDTAYLKITIEGNKYLPCYPEKIIDGELQKEFLNESGTHFAISMKGGKKVIFEYIDGKGSAHNYVGGYEIKVNQIQHLDEVINNVKRTIYFENPNAKTQYQVQSIKEAQRDIFLWLDFLDLNVIIILALMLLIGTINMSSGLLVLIITKTQLIGLLKAIGTNNWDVRKLFLYQAMFIVLRGIIIGNVIGIGLAILQQQFSIIPLNPEVYYLDTVPIEINYWEILLLNLGTFVLCIAALVIPSYVVTKISPIKALKFD